MLKNSEKYIDVQDLYNDLELSPDISDNISGNNSHSPFGDDNEPLFFPCIILLMNHKTLGERFFTAHTEQYDTYRNGDSYIDYNEQYSYTNSPLYLQPLMNIDKFEDMDRPEFSSYLMGNQTNKLFSLDPLSFSMPASSCKRQEIPYSNYDCKKRKNTDSQDNDLDYDNQYDLQSTSSLWNNIDSFHLPPALSCDFKPSTVLNDVSKTSSNQPKCKEDKYSVFVAQNNNLRSNLVSCDIDISDKSQSSKPDLQVSNSQCIYDDPCNTTKSIFSLNSVNNNSNYCSSSCKSSPVTSALSDSTSDSSYLLLPSFQDEMSVSSPKAVSPLHTTSSSQEHDSYSISSNYSSGEKTKKPSESIRQKKRIKKWTDDEDISLMEAVSQYGDFNWKRIASRIPGRTANQCQQRWRRCINVEVKGQWKEDENQRLRDAVSAYNSSGIKINWKQVAKLVGTRSCEKCHTHWDQVLSPNVNKTSFTLEDDLYILKQYNIIGSKWSTIGRAINRTGIQIKNRFKQIKNIKK